MITTIIVILLIVSILLFVAETLVIPGFGLCGLIGIGLSCGAFYLAYINHGLLATIALLLICIAIFATLCIALSKSRLIERYKLHSSLDGHVDNRAGHDVHIGDIGTSLSRLNLYGKVNIGGHTFEAKSTRYIDADVAVEVVAVEDNHLIVKQITNNQN